MRLESEQSKNFIPNISKISLSNHAADGKNIVIDDIGV